MEYALVFGGGGGKGAYEIGVWKALHEMGYADRFACVIGTSAGALNGALVCLKNPEMAERIWLEEISQETILPLNVGFLSGNLSGIYQQDGLKRLLENYLPETLPDSPDFYVCVSKMGQSGGNPGLLETLFAEENYQTEYVKMNGLARRDAIPVLLASAAIPFLYSPVGSHRDGGMLARNNVPYLEAVRMGYEKILAVSLSNETLVFERNRIRERQRGAKDEGKPLPGENRGAKDEGKPLPGENRGVTHEGKPLPGENRGVSETLILCPSVSLGGLFDGTLDFSASGAKRRMERGYEDCMRIYRGRIDAFFLDAPTP